MGQIKDLDHTFVFRSSFLVLSLILCVGCVDRRYEHGTELAAAIGQAMILLRLKISCPIEQFQPEVGFSRFLQCYLELGNKVCSALSIFRLLDVCTDRGAALSNLTGKNILVFVFQPLGEPDDFDRKLHGKL